MEALSCALARTAVLHQGDPGIMGWLIVAAYVVAALCCFAVAVRAGPNPPCRVAERLFWALCAAALAFLAVNKQLDLHILFSKSLRCLAASKGWTDEARRTLQQRVVISIAAAVVIIGGIVVVAIRRSLGQVWLAIAGLAVVTGFAFMRAAAFNRLDGPLHTLLNNVAARSVIELYGPGILVAAALLRVRRAPRPC